MSFSESSYTHSSSDTPNLLQNPGYYSKPILDFSYADTYTSQARGYEGIQHNWPTPYVHISQDYLSETPIFNHTYSSGVSYPPSQGYTTYDTTNIPIHTPIPIPHQHSILSMQVSSPPPPPPAPATDYHLNYDYPPLLSSPFEIEPPTQPLIPESYNAKSNSYVTPAPLQGTFQQLCASQKHVEPFPTPSEMLSSQSSPTLSSPTQSSSVQSSPSTRSRGAAARTAHARQARRKASTQSVGFIPTDHDTISSHDKKRHYLECLENYVLYLEDQLTKIKETPIALEKVTDYPGLSSRSIRTLLVHMENTVRKADKKRVQEEHRFMTLRDTLIKEQGAADALRDYQEQLTTQTYGAAELSYV